LKNVYRDPLILDYYTKIIWNIVVGQYSKVELATCSVHRFTDAEVIALLHAIIQVREVFDFLEGIIVNMNDIGSDLEKQKPP